MCDAPIEHEGKTFACRRCNKCIATRRAQWVARGMAERAMHPFCFSLTLTYEDQTQENRDAAAMFCYDDVRAFFHRMRSALRKKQAGSVRFLCAGEQGERNGRCHWHVIVYTSLEVWKLGRIVGLKPLGRVLVKQDLTDPEDIITVGPKKKRLDWSLWPHGFATIQVGDQDSLEYALSYISKDLFTAERSEGFARERTSENFATGFFRMSKRPAIGLAYFMREFEALDKSGSVWPSLNFQIPDMRGYFHPSGSFRRFILWNLVALNQRCIWATGANAPQWADLLSACHENENDLGILTNEKTDENPDDFEAFAFQIAKRGRESAGNRATADRRRRCGHTVPCFYCRQNFSDQELEKCGQRRIFKTGFDSFETFDGSPINGVFTGRENPQCALKGSPENRRAFPSAY